MKPNTSPAVPRFGVRSELSRSAFPRALVIVGILATLILAGLSFVAVGMLGGGFTAGGPGSLFGACTVPNLSGTVVNVTLTNMGGPKMGGRNGPMSGGAMRLNVDRATVRHGTVSFLVTNGAASRTKWWCFRFTDLTLWERVRSTATRRSTKGAAWGRHPTPAVKARARESCPEPQAG
jgi:hypothetical protein